MKIAEVVSTFYPQLGGMGKVAYQECEELTKRGEEPTVFTLRYRGTDYKRFNFPFKVERLTPIIKSGDAGLLPQLFIKLKKFDLVHLHYPFYGGAEWAALASVIFKKPLFVTWHMDAKPEGAGPRIVKFLYDFIWEKKIFKRAKRILVVDKASFLACKRRTRYENKVTELGNPVNTEIFRPRTPNFAELGIRVWENKKIVLFVGNLMPVKGLDILLAALPKLSPEVVLAVVGGGYDEEFYKYKVIEEKLSERVKFIGRVNDEQTLAKWFNAASCVCVPSLYESFSLVILEALVSGAPVVASDLPGIKERVGEGGLVFSAGDSVALERAINSLLAWTHDEKNRRMREARNRILPEHELIKHGEKLMRIFLKKN